MYKQLNTPNDATDLKTKSHKKKAKRNPSEKDYSKEYFELFKGVNSPTIFEWTKEGDSIKIFSLFDEDQRSFLSMNTTQITEE